MQRTMIGSYTDTYYDIGSYTCGSNDKDNNNEDQKDEGNSAYPYPVFNCFFSSLNISGSFPFMGVPVFVHTQPIMFPVVIGCSKLHHLGISALCWALGSGVEYSTFGILMLRTLLRMHRLLNWIHLLLVYHEC